MEYKNKGVSNVLAVAMIFFVMVAAGLGVYFISSRVSQEQAVAPTAPESEPFASTGCCKNPSQCSSKEYCNASCVCKPKAPTPTGYGENYKCTAEVCPGPCFSCNSTKTSCIAHPEAVGCGSVSTGVGGDPNNCGGTGKVCPANTTCKNGNCVTTGGTTVTPLPSSAPTSYSITPITQPTSGPNPCDGKDGRPSCERDFCHCLYGDDCGKSTNPNGIYECVNTTGGLRDQCLSQNRAWCLNQYGQGMTCCAVGYSCASKAGCVQTGPTATPPKTTTKTPTTPPTNPPTQPPVAACTEIRLFAPLETSTTCTTNSDCTAAGQDVYCDTAKGLCNIWSAVTVSEIPTKATIGKPIKASFTATNVSKLEAKLNNGSYEPTTKNPTTGKYDYIFNIPSAGTFSVSAKYYAQ